MEGVAECQHAVQFAPEPSPAGTQVAEDGGAANPRVLVGAGGFWTNAGAKRSQVNPGCRCGVCVRWFRYADLGP